jgi:hypothetical protein
MKKVLWIVSLIFLATAGCAAYISLSEGGYPSPAGGSYAVGPQDSGTDLDTGYCYNYLAPYGNWVSMSPYGYVWCPRNMGYRWRPYSNGHWVWTDYGWTWISDFEWGWVPFHYGRWGWDDDLGWYWVPGTVWGPAWVTWRSSDLYMGWAPFPPGIEFRAGMNFASLSFNIPGRFWIFIGGSHFMDRNISSYVIPYERNTTIINNTVLHNNFGFRGNTFINNGIGVDTVRRVTRQNVPIYRLQDARQPGRAGTMGNTVQLYRPSFRANTGVRPRTFLSRDQARQELAPARVFEPRERSPKLTPESAVLQRQAEERKLLEESQSQEMRALDQRQSEEQRNVRTPSERARIQQSYQAKRTQIAKQHQAETQQLNERHKNDAAQVKQAAPRKKENETQPKKIQ